MTFLDLLICEVIEAAKLADSMSREPDAAGDLLEHILIPTELTLDLPVGINRHGRLRQWRRHDRRNAELRIRFERTSTPEATRNQIDDLNEIDRLILERDRPHRFQERYQARGWPKDVPVGYNPTDPPETP